MKCAKRARRVMGTETETAIPTDRRLMTVQSTWRTKTKKNVSLSTVGCPDGDQLFLIALKPRRACTSAGSAADVSCFDEIDLLLFATRLRTGGWESRRSLAFFPTAGSRETSRGSGSFNGFSRSELLSDSVVQRL